MNNRHLHGFLRCLVFSIVFSTAWLIAGRQLIAQEMTLLSDPVETCNKYQSNPNQRGYTPDRTNSYIDCQLLLIGPSEQIEKIVIKVNDILSPTVTLMFTEKTDFSYLAPVSATLTYTSGLLSKSLAVYNIVYDVPADVPYTYTLQDVRQFVQLTAKGMRATVSVQLNHLQGDPNSVGAKAGPLAPAPANDQDMSASAVQQQWALNVDSGIGLYTDTGRLVTQTGEGVRIVIFDSSPVLSSTITTKERLSITEWLSITHPTEVICQNDSGNKPDCANQHGFFVAGLAHTVAPSATIELVRVLDGKMRGDLFTLIQALNQTISKTLPLGGEYPLSHTVINLSLVITSSVAYNEPAMILLEQVLTSAKDLGATIVAAAGNGSCKEDDLTYRKETKLPAAFPSVLGIAATNKERQISRFSNQPGSDKLAAPGGDNGDSCKIMLEGLFDEVAADKSLLSMTWDGGYGRWSGSSFSSALVSGMAALVIEKLGDEDDMPEKVSQALWSGACALDKPSRGVFMVSARSLNQDLQCP